MCTLSNISKMAYFYAVCAVRTTIFSTGGKFCPVLRIYMLLLKSPFLCGLGIMYCIYCILASYTVYTVYWHHILYTVAYCILASYTVTVAYCILASYTVYCSILYIGIIYCILWHTVYWHHILYTVAYCILASYTVIHVLYILYILYILEL